MTETQRKIRDLVARQSGDHLELIADYLEAAIALARLAGATAQRSADVAFIRVQADTLTPLSAACELAALPLCVSTPAAAMPPASATFAVDLLLAAADATTQPADERPPALEPRLPRGDASDMPVPQLQRLLSDIPIAIEDGGPSPGADWLEGMRAIFNAASNAELEEKVRSQLQRKIELQQATLEAKP